MSVDEPGLSIDLERCKASLLSAVTERDAARADHARAVDLARRIQEGAERVEKQLGAENERLRGEVARLTQAHPLAPHDHIRIEGCYRCVWPDDQAQQPASVKPD